MSLGSCRMGGEGKGLCAVFKKPGLPDFLLMEDRDSRVEVILHYVLKPFCFTFSLLSFIAYCIFKREDLSKGIM